MPGPGPIRRDRPAASPRKGDLYCSATVDYYGIYPDEAIDTAVAKVRTVLEPEG